MNPQENIKLLTVLKIQLKYGLIDFFQFKKRLKITAIGVIPIFLISLYVFTILIEKSTIGVPQINLKLYIQSTLWIMVYWLGALHPLTSSMMKITKIITGPYEDKSYLLLFSQNPKFRSKYYFSQVILSIFESFLQICINYILYFGLAFIFFTPKLAIIGDLLLLITGIGVIAFVYNIIVIFCCVCMNFFMDSKKVLTFVICVLFLLILLPFQFKFYSIESGSGFDGTFTKVYVYYEYVIYFDPMQLLFHLWTYGNSNFLIFPFGFHFTEDMFFRVIVGAMKPLDTYITRFILALLFYITIIPSIGIALIFLKKTIIKEEDLQ